MTREAKPVIFSINLSRTRRAQNAKHGVHATEETKAGKPKRSSFVEEKVECHPELIIHSNSRTEGFRIWIFLTGKSIFAAVVLFCS